ncbi:MAG: lipoprotein [Gammaproteobacteria bacterium]|nr:lipoprotein [Gammaproteobacteria bacterium]
MRLCYSIVMFMALIMLTSGISLLAGCGQKGALYLPAEPAPASVKQTKKTNKSTTATKQ